MLNVLPLDFKLILAGCLAINNNNNLLTLCEITFGNETRVHFLLLAYLKRSLLNSSVYENVDIHEGAFADWSHIKEEVLFFNLIDLEDMISSALIDISILTLDNFTDGFINNLSGL
jgi:hypothetical protein